MISMAAKETLIYQKNVYHMNTKYSCVMAQKENSDLDYL